MSRRSGHNAWGSQPCGTYDPLVKGGGLQANAARKNIARRRVSPSRHKVGDYEMQWNGGVCVDWYIDIDELDWGSGRGMTGTALYITYLRHSIQWHRSLSHAPARLSFPCLLIGESDLMQGGTWDAHIFLTTQSSVHQCDCTHPCGSHHVSGHRRSRHRHCLSRDTQSRLSLSRSAEPPPSHF